MSPRIAVVALSDSFSDVWPQLACFAGAELELAGRVGEIHSLQSTCGVLIAAGGMEDAAIPLLRELGAAEAPPIVVVGAEHSYRLVANLMEAGAANYFALPSDFALCRSWFKNRAEAVTDQQNLAQFAVAERQRFDFSRLIGSSKELKATLERLSRVIPLGTPTVLITGETGTGKELVARAIHYNGGRATGPFVEINCTTLPETLLEAELFGYEPGAFTDAKVSKPGLFEVADGGTLFLDEIGDMTMSLQGKLLRVLEDHHVRRLGSVRESEIDVRVVAATHVDLPQAVRNGLFRRDLFYRLNVVPVRLPTLRERGDDVIILAEHFLQRFSVQYALRRPTITPDIKRALRTHTWPGNVRELRNAIERGILLGDGNLFVEDLLPDESAPTLPGILPFPASLREIERAAARAMVERCGGNKSEAAKVLKISRKHLYTLLLPEEPTT